MGNVAHLQSQSAQSKQNSGMQWLSAVARQANQAEDTLLHTMKSASHNSNSGSCTADSAAAVLGGLQLLKAAT
jgi:hypothetical protein